MNRSVFEHSHLVQWCSIRNASIMNKKLSPLFAATTAAIVMMTGLSGPVAMAQSVSDQGEARKEMKAGNVLPLREIERRVATPLKSQGHEYLGPAYDSTVMAYRLKFIRDGRVTFVDVDARSGRILQRSR